MTLYKAIATLVASGSLLGSVSPAFALTIEAENEMETDMSIDESPSEQLKLRARGRAFKHLPFNLRPQKADQVCGTSETKEERKQCIQKHREEQKALRGEIRSLEKPVKGHIHMALNTFWKNIQKRLHMVFKQEAKIAIEECSQKETEQEQKECVVRAKAHIKAEFIAAINGEE